MAYETVPTSVTAFMEMIKEKCGKKHYRWAENFEACFANTLLTTVKRFEDGTTYLLTGDIPAMWLRDSVAQVRPYLVIAKNDPEIADMISGLVKRQFDFINHDPYANAFNEAPNGAGHQDDLTDMTPWIWERKYEIDSLCYPIQLAYLLYKNTGKTDQFDETFISGVDKILHLWTVEQNHDEKSPYKFARVKDTWELDQLSKNPCAYTGMTWSGFRPSDDSCTYGYLVPSNMFAVVVLDYLKEIFKDILKETSRLEQITKLRNDIQQGIENYAKTQNADGKAIYAYETDGHGNFNIMDDSNVPSLLSAPYLGYCEEMDPVYLETRKTILSKENPFYYEGSYARGIGSPHTPENYVWPIALAMEAMTISDKLEKERILNFLVASDAGTKLMHEGFHVDDPTKYTREWFSWANMMFCELVMDYFDIRVQK